MYVGDYNKNLKSSNLAVLRKELAAQEKDLAKSLKKGKQKAIDMDRSQIAALQARIAEVEAANAPAPTPAPTVPAIVTPPPPTVSAPVTVAPVTQVAPPAPSVAPPPAAESFAPPIIQVPTLFTPPPSSTPDSAPAASAPQESSKMPLILGAVGVGALLLILAKRKR